MAEIKDGELLLLGRERDDCKYFPNSLLRYYPED